MHSQGGTYRLILAEDIVPGPTKSCEADPVRVLDTSPGSEAWGDISPDGLAATSLAQWVEAAKSVFTIHSFTVTRATCKDAKRKARRVGGAVEAKETPPLGRGHCLVVVLLEAEGHAIPTPAIPPVNGYEQRGSVDAPILADNQDVECHNQ